MANKKRAQDGLHAICRGPSLLVVLVVALHCGVKCPLPTHLPPPSEIMIDCGCLCSCFFPLLLLLTTHLRHVTPQNAMKQMLLLQLPSPAPAPALALRLLCSCSAPAVILLGLQTCTVPNATGFSHRSPKLAHVHVGRLRGTRENALITAEPATPSSTIFLLARLPCKTQWIFSSAGTNGWEWATKECTAHSRESKETVRTGAERLAQIINEAHIMHKVH